LVYGDTDAFIAEIESEFNLGSSPDLLLESERLLFAEVVDRVCAANRDNAPPDGSDVYLSDSTQRDLELGKPKRDREHALAEDDRALFAHYGILPAHRLRTVSRNALAKISRSVGRICESGPVGTSVGYLFCKPLFDLATNPEIVARVASLLGDDLTCVGTSGPMYIPPGGVGTEWHFAAGVDFGGGTKDVNLDLVTCWLALDDVPRERAPMKMLTRSFPGNLAVHSHELSAGRPEDASSLVEDPTKLDGYLHDALAGLDRLPFKISDDLAKRLVARRFNSRRIPKLQFTHDGAPRYNPFHRRVDTLMRVGPATLRRGQSLDMIAMDAAQGDLYTFTSLNTHGSLPNLTSEWRRAIAIRYVRTGAASANHADNHFALLQTYGRLFPETNEVFRAAGKQLEQFEQVCPRIAVSGEVPDSVAPYYWDVDCLRQVLKERPMLGQRVGRARAEASETSSAGKLPV
jgi:ectoine hydroxylase-related dioxygenase (phytanoyl-CoA dioxygenase family)